MFLGREKELKDIEKAIKENKSKIIAITGRRGVGKTELTREFQRRNENKSNYSFINLFGEKEVSMKKQIFTFMKILERNWFISQEEKEKIKGDDWFDVFYLLSELIKKEVNKSKKIIFIIDEFPWLHTRKSNFVERFSTFWNRTQGLDNIYFILTGSAIAWMGKNVINSKGGLYSKVYLNIYLKSFDFLETSRFLLNKNKLLSISEILNYYLLTNGVARYLDKIKIEETIEKNCEYIFRSKDFITEFDLLFNSSFEGNLEVHQKIIELFKDKKEITTPFIQKKINDVSKSPLLSAIKDLVYSDLIIKKEKMNKKLGRNENVYMLNDLFCFSYLKIIGKKEQATSVMNGFAFEILARKNLNLIKQSLGRLNIETEELYFENRNAQIDLLLKSKDDVYYLIECKNYNKEFTIDVNYKENLENKIKELHEYLINQKRKNFQIKLALFTIYGTKNNPLSFNDVALIDIWNIDKKLNL